MVVEKELTDLYMLYTNKGLSNFHFFDAAETFE